MDLFFWILIAFFVLSTLFERAVRRGYDPGRRGPDGRPAPPAPRRAARPPAPWGPPPVQGPRPPMYFPPEQEAEMRRAAEDGRRAHEAGRGAEGVGEPVTETEGREGNGADGVRDASGAAPAPAAVGAPDVPVPGASAPRGRLPALFRTDDDVLRGVLLAELLGPPRARRTLR